VRNVLKRPVDEPCKSIDPKQIVSIGTNSPECDLISQQSNIGKQEKEGYFYSFSLFLTF
jgi:hypothetical protein